MIVVVIREQMTTLFPARTVTPSDVDSLQEQGERGLPAPTLPLQEVKNPLLGRAGGLASMAHTSGMFAERPPRYPVPNCRETLKRAAKCPLHRSGNGGRTPYVLSYSGYY
ncbi:UNVERIFIED_CONTAM: hypothetical protein Sradi_3989700 [Sesamum radiatum]|uniref:Uncharacterized protein n=1 Tax=Sesamum radiatum TaxID=300843 RepID=A0AAW2PK40_SESRA